MSKGKVRDWLNDLGYPGYARTFSQKNIDAATLGALEQREFEDLGVKHIHIRKIIRERTSFLMSLSKVAAPTKTSSARAGPTAMMVRQWLETVNTHWQPYATRFYDEQIDGEGLLELCDSPSAFESLGVKRLHIKKLTRMAKDWLATMGMGTGASEVPRVSNSSQRSGQLSPIRSELMSSSPRASGQRDPRPTIMRVKSLTRKTDILHHYTMGKFLGEGGFAVVKLGIRKRDGAKFAIKMMKKAALSEKELADIQGEVGILSNLDHPGVVKMEEVYDCGRKYCIVLELLDGGELFDRMVELNTFSERDASHIAKQIAEALKYMHDNGIAHRDMKPENLVYKTAGGRADSVLKITDFGMAKKSKAHQYNMRTTIGSPDYIAPEILRGEPYGQAVDMWSVGVILYVLLSGRPPWNSEHNQEIFREIKQGEYSLELECWADISERAKSCVRSLMSVDESQRLKADEMLRHPFLVDRKKLTNKAIAKKNRDSLRRYQIRRKFRRGVRAMMALCRMVAVLNPGQGTTAVFKMARARSVRDGRRVRTTE